MRTRVWVCSLLLAVCAFGAPAWAAKVKICHVPPGNPANFHTITVSDNAVQAHLGHGDLLGACFAHCDQLCDDGNACTIDACDASEQCLLSHPPVNCNDSNLCTIDSCDPAVGCSSTPKVCHDGANCTVDTCDPLTGNCAFPPVSCPAGQSCNATTGSCETELTCPCVGQIAGFAEALESDLVSCSDFSVPGTTFLILNTGTFLIEAEASPGNNSGFCGELFSSGFLITTAQEGEDCAALIRQKAAAAGLSCGEGPAS
jgi:hypothetical protein